MSDIWTFIDEEDSRPSSSFDFEALREGNEVSADVFEQPCVPMGVSGGTAAFFQLRMKAGMRPDVPSDYYIGKDLSHAIDEFDFYKKLRQAIATEPYWATFGKIAMECPGVAKMFCGAADKEPKERPLLLLENLRVGYRKMRLLDVKLGAETAIAGWKGKSQLASWKNACVDKCTNSTVEGFRLEGMELPPAHLDEKLQMAIEMRNKGSSLTGNFVSAKATKRFMLQRLRASELLSAWATVDYAPMAGTTDSFSTTGRSAMAPRSSSHSVASVAPTAGGTALAELHAHAAIWGAIQAVGEVRRAVTGIPVPQTWIGSSLALGVEVAEMSQKPLVTAKVFDWGRSDLSTEKEYKQKSDEEKKFHILHWRQYLSAIIRFQYELCRVAEHRCCCPVWTAFVCELTKEDFSLTKAVVMGDSKADKSTSAGMYELPAVTPPSSKRRVRLPLVPKGSQAPCASLHLLVTSRRLEAGETSIHVEVQRLSNVLLTNAADGEVVKATIIAFERVADAKRCIKAFHAGDVRPQPEGRAYVRETAPIKIADGEAKWSDCCMEWVGLGERAKEAHATLEKLLPSRPETLPKDAVMLRYHPHPLEPVQDDSQNWHCDDPCKDCAWKSKTSVRRYTCRLCLYDACHKCVKHWSEATGNLSYPELLPPTIGSSRRMEMAAQAFLAHTAPYAQESAPVPSQWH